ncbi:MAG: hypothetical protein BAJALOKI3v1_140045 [Promethearchaeota archaeon]|nr:MAG: hypothetical protein BAJALOKI3v1_140045 [Candidatus Lokiarchaeota archaeon]
MFNKGNCTYINLSNVKREFNEQGYKLDIIVEDDPESGDPEIIAEIEY